MKSLSETVKDGELRKCQLQEQIDQLNEECAKLSAQGQLRSCYVYSIFTACECDCRNAFGRICLTFVCLSVPFVLCNF